MDNLKQLKNKTQAELIAGESLNSLKLLMLNELVNKGFDPLNTEIYVSFSVQDPTQIYILTKLKDKEIALRGYVIIRNGEFIFPNRYSAFTHASKVSYYSETDFSEVKPELNQIGYWKLDISDYIGTLSIEP